MAATQNAKRLAWVAFGVRVPGVVAMADGRNAQLNSYPGHKSVVLPWPARPLKRQQSAFEQSASSCASVKPRLSSSGKSYLLLLHRRRSRRFRLPQSFAEFSAAARTVLLCVLLQHMLPYFRPPTSHFLLERLVDDEQNKFAEPETDRSTPWKACSFPYHAHPVERPSAEWCRARAENIKRGHDEEPLKEAARQFLDDVLEETTPRYSFLRGRPARATTSQLMSAVTAV